MKYPTLLSLLSALFFLNLAADCVDCLPDTISTLNTEELALYTELRNTLASDGLAAHDEAVKIEFEFHDLFINEEIPLEMQKYQQLLQRYGIQPGPQRQIHLLTNGQLVIGDFDDWGRMMGAPVRVAPRA